MYSPDLLLRGKGSGVTVNINVFPEVGTLKGNPPRRSELRPSFNDRFYFHYSFYVREDKIIFFPT